MLCSVDETDWPRFCCAVFFNQFVTRIATVMSKSASHSVGVVGRARAGAGAEAWHTHKFT